MVNSLDDHKADETPDHSTRMRKKNAAILWAFGIPRDSRELETQTAMIQEVIRSDTIYLVCLEGVFASGRPGSAPQSLRPTDRIDLIKFIRELHVDTVLMVTFPGYVISQATLEHLWQYHDTHQSEITIFRPTVPHAARSPYVVAEVIHTKSLTMVAVYRQLLAQHLKKFLKNIIFSGKLKYLIKSALQKFHAGKLVFTLKNRLLGSTSENAHLDVFCETGLKNPTAATHHESLADLKKTSTYPGTSAEAEFFLVDHIADHIPMAETIYVIPSNTCNLRCIMCPIWSPQFPHATTYYNDKKFMSRELFMQVARVAARYGSTIRIGMVDEPLLHRELPDFIRLAKNAGVPKIGITTNATLLRREIDIALIQAGLDVLCVSLDAATPETYKKIRGGNFHKVVENVHGLLNLKKTLHSLTPEVDMIIIDQEPAHGEIQRFIDYWLPRVHSVAVNKLTVVKDKVDVLSNPYASPKPLERTPCISPWRELVVLPEGNVLSCCVSAMNLARNAMSSLGNLHQNTLEEIWSGPAFNQLRKNILYNRFNEASPHCYDCQFWVNNDEIAKHYFRHGRHITETQWITLYKYL